MAPQVGGQLFGVHPPIIKNNYQILILKQRQIFKISYFNKCYYSFEKNFLSPNISKNHQNIYKMAQNIDMWDERRDSWLLETWTRYLRQNHNTQTKYGLQVEPRLKYEK